MSNRPKVSIVIPIFNVEKYLRQCLDSVVNQTLKDIEIICVNDGSTDSSPDIIREYMAKDSRVKILDKTNSGYGSSMNMGFDMATGEYLGIVESDDYAEADMFENLYNRAKEHGLDVIKSSYYLYWSIPREMNQKQEIVSRVMHGKTVCPRTSFPAKAEMVEFFNIKPTIWSSIYRADFIRSNNIRFNETPGASYQDAGFNFKVWCCAERVQLVKDAYLHYRQDNENSSVNSKGKVFCICDEYEEMARFLADHPLFQGELEYIKNRLKYDSYIWNYDRLALKYKYIFIERFGYEFQEDFEDGRLNPEYFSKSDWEDLMSLIEDPIAYHTYKQLSASDSAITREQYYAAIGGRGKVGKKSESLLQGAIQCVQDHGVLYTLSWGLKKLSKRFGR